jgi:hypothetical protein
VVKLCSNGKACALNADVMTADCQAFKHDERMFNLEPLQHRGLQIRDATCTLVTRSISEESVCSPELLKIALKRTSEMEIFRLD